MQNNYWIKDDTRKEIITKTQIPNEGNFNLFACYFNLLDKKGLSFPINSKPDFQMDKVFRKNGFEYIVLTHNDLKEFLVLPNEKLNEYTDNIASKIGHCKNETDVLNLMITEM